MRKNNSGFLILETIALVAIIATSIITTLLVYKGGLDTTIRHNKRSYALQLAYIEISNASGIAKSGSRLEGEYIIKTGHKIINKGITYKENFVEVYYKDDKLPLVNLFSYE